MGTRPLLLRGLCLLAVLNLAACYSFWRRSWHPRNRCPPTCLRCSQSGSTVCDQCRPGYKLVSGRSCTIDTSQCAEHCLFCGKNGRNKCDTCERGYLLTLQKTCSKDAKCADHCVSCVRLGEAKCDYCDRGYLMMRDYTCVARIDECAANCLFCYWSGKDKCDDCETGFVMTSKDTCEPEISPCAENCETCQKNGQKKCDLCYFGYMLTRGKTCELHGSCAANCLFCYKNGKKKCDLCKHGYTLTLDKTCSSSVKCAEHCDSCWWTGQGKCDVCLPGYILTRDKTCSTNVKCAEHCQSCHFSGESKCDVCDNGYARTYDKTCTPVRGKPHPGQCPSVPTSASGICHEGCRIDADCPQDSKCCSIGCGHVCKKAVAQTGPCAEHCLSCKENGRNKCDVCERGYKLTEAMTCTSSPVCTEETNICLKDWNSVYHQTYDPQWPETEKRTKLCNLLPKVKGCMEDLENVCDEDGTWITSMEMVSAYEVNCAPTTKRTPTKSSPATSTTERTPDKQSSTTPASFAENRRVVMVIRLAMEWKDEYKDLRNEDTKELVTHLHVSLHAIYKRVKGFRDVQVETLFKSSVGVIHIVEFDHELTDVERTTLALTLTAALADKDNTLILGRKRIPISGKAEMLVAGEKVEVNGACFLYDKKQLCQHGGSCVAGETSPRCVCASGYSGVYCGVSASSPSTKGRVILGPVIGGIGVFLLVGIVVFAVLLYRKRSAEKQGTQTPDGGVDNPLYAVFTSRGRPSKR